MSSNTTEISPSAQIPEATPSEMKDERKIKLTKIEDDGIVNNYREFEVKLKFKLDSVGLWEYIEGEKAQAPVIPELRDDKNITTKDPTTLADVVVLLPGNKQEVEDARQKAGLWMKVNKRILALIIDAVPTFKLYLVRDCKTAKDAWDALKREYRPINLRRATLMKTKISSYAFQHGMAAKMWMNDMRSMYSELCGLDPTGRMMTDDSFARLIIELMPKDDDWRFLASTLMNELRTADREGRTLSSRYVMEQLRDEVWRITLHDERKNTTVFSAKMDPSTTREVAASNLAYGPNKRPRTQPKVMCENEYCERPIGHEKSECLAYGGGAAGKYHEGYRGPRDIHLSPAERVKQRRAKYLKRGKRQG